MSQYSDLWRKKMQSNGGSIANSLLNHSKRMYANSFKDDPSYKSAILKKSDLTEITIDTRVINVDKTTSEKKIQILPDNVVGIGDYIVYPNKTYLIEGFESNVVVPYSKVTECNQRLKWIDKHGNVHEFPCIISNDSYGSKSLSDNDVISQGDTKVKILIQNNEFVKHIPLGFRFIFNQSNHDIYSAIDITTSVSKGLVSIVCKKVLPIAEDDILNNIAYNDFEIDTTNYTIIGEDKLKANSVGTYALEPIDNNVVYSLDDISVCEIVSQGNGQCVVRGLVINEIATLSATVNNVVVDTKNIFVSR